MIFPDYILNEKIKINSIKLIITGLLGISLLISFAFIYIKLSLPKRSGEVAVSGLTDKVTVHFDKYGRAHVNARNIHDLVFTQGYLTAQDRLFQMDITRRAAKGELSEILGKRGLVRDKFVRTIGLLNSAERELKNIDKETLKILNDYSSGVSAYIEKHKHMLPIEFKVLNYKPKPWEPIDSVILIKQLAEIIDTSWQLDLIRQDIYQSIPQEHADNLFEQNFPGNPIINYDAKKYLVFDEYILKKPNLLQRWKNIKGKVAIKKILKAPYFKIKRKIIEAADFLRNGADRWEGFNWGSNCWVIGKNKSKTPILANDPHMDLSIPSFWYPIHLINKSSRLNALGLSIPGLPGILIGHNGKAAWGITSLSADVQDVFIGEFKDVDSLFYKNGQGFREAKIESYEIKVKNQKKPYIHKNIITECGPVLDRYGKKAITLKWSTIEASDYDSVGSIWSLAYTKDWNSFRENLKKYGGPTLSFHYVDTSGNVGYQAAGIIPQRAQGVGDLPISGLECNKYWLGNIPFDKLPNAYNPQVGYLVSANNKVVSPQYEYNLGNNFLSPFRAGRISTLLSQKENLDQKINQDIQKDLYSWVANYITVQILDAYYDSKMINKDLLPSVQLLSKWDFNLSTGSPQALIFEKTYENLFKKILFPKLGEKLTKDYLKEWRAGSLALIRILINENKYWLPSGVKNYQSLFLISLSDALKEIKKITGSNDLSKWHWGKYHTLTFEHPFSKSVPILGPLTNVGPIYVGGDRDTISAFGTNTNLKVFWGPSARVVIDLNDLNNAHVQLPLGISSTPGSEHYKDQTKDWVENNGEPFVYDEEIIAKKSKWILVLEPSLWGQLKKYKQQNRVR